MHDPLLLPELREMLNENDVAAMQEFCGVFHPGVCAENLDALSAVECWSVLSHTNVDRRAEVFAFLPLSRQMELVATVEKKELTALLEAMASDDRATLLKNMNEEKLELLLPLIAHAERTDIRKLLSYPDHSAGAIMTTDYASLPEGVTVREALARLRHQAPDRETIYYVYVIDDARHLHGFISLRKLFLARPDALVADLMDTDVISVRVDDDQEMVAHKIARYDFIAMPVVDDQGRLVGIVTHDDVLDVVQQEATEDVHRLGGVEPLEDGYLSTSFFTLAWKRGIWLVLLLVAGFGTSAILSHYNSETEHYEWLVWFLPLVLASGGNAGSQSATLVIRALALGQLNRQTQYRIGRREFLTGLTLGGTLAVMGFTFARLYISTADAAVVAATVALVVTFGTVNGTLLPIILKQLGLDPALMSNPLIASLSDMMGVLIYYNVALLALGI
jgi:magnesium transporter